MSLGPPIGIVLAGGESRRFGSQKALTELDGELMISRVCRLLQPRVETVGVVSNDPDVQGRVEWPVRPDLRPGLGPAGGVLTALSWAREEDAGGALVLACDLPLVPGSLLDLLLDRFGGTRPVAPESPGPLGVEPLCAVYPANGFEPAASHLEKGAVPAHELLAELEPLVVPLREIEAVCDPGRAFLNVNRPADRERAATLLREAIA